jgi:hypothetical protein
LPLNVDISAADPDPGSGMKKTGSGIRDDHPESHFRELNNNILVHKYLNYFKRIGMRDLSTLDPGPGMEKFGSGDIG